MTTRAEGSGQFMDGTVPVSLYQAGGYGMSQCTLLQDDLFHGRKLREQSLFDQVLMSTNGPRQIQRLTSPSRDFLACHVAHEVSHEQCSLEFDIKYTGIAGTAFNLSTLIQRKWHAQVEWTTNIADEDLLPLNKKHSLLEQTLYALGLDYRKLPVKCDPAYHHVAATENNDASAHQSSMMSLMSGQAPPTLGQPSCKRQAAPPAGFLSGQPSSSASPARTGYEVLSEHVDKSRKTDPQQCPFMVYAL